VVGFLIDLSNNSRIHWKIYQDAILELVWNMLPGDKRYTGYLISYANTADITVNTTWIRENRRKGPQDEARRRRGAIRRHLPGLHPPRTGQRRALRTTPHHHRGRDGHDNSSTHNLEEVLELAQRNLVTIYGISTMAFGFSNEDQDVLEKLTARPAATSNTR